MFKVDQEVLHREMYQRNSDWRPVIVSRVGRKWVTVKSVEYGHEFRTQYSLEDGQARGESRSRIATYEQVAKEKADAEISEFLRRLNIHTFQVKVKFQDMVKVAELLKELGYE